MQTTTEARTPPLERTHPAAAPTRKPVKRLDPWVAERIAAGEVIERPASVVKELVENALDAGATEIEVRLEDGGKALIEVTDNGAGMSADDLALAIERHATSKVASLDDLDRIASLGFRGEALPSIAAATQLTITSRTSSSATAHLLDAESKTLEPTSAGHFLHAPHGTRITARGLFHTIPARLKFLKSASAEVSQVREWMERLALAYPTTGFKLLSDERQVLSLRPQSEIERVRAVLTAAENYPIETATNDPQHADGGPLAMDQAFKIRAHWIRGLSLPQSRKLVQVVNGRAVRDKLLQQAVLGPFRQALLPGQFPAIALYVELPPSTLDVNVHPAKTEVRFLDSSKVFRAVQAVTERLLQTGGGAVVVPTRPGFTHTESVAPTPLAFSFSQPLRAAEREWPRFESAPHASDETLEDAAPAASPATNSATPQPSSRASGIAELAEQLRAERFAGILFQTYFMYDLGEEAVLIDQHAAHERVRFERLKRDVLGQGIRPAAQQLLLPEVVTLEDGTHAWISAQLPLLARMGFEAELFGESSLIFRALPIAWAESVKPGAASAELRTRLANLIERLVAERDSLSDTPTELLLDEAVFERLASEACHGSVRAGDRLDPAHAHALLAQLWQCANPWNCPHGRPTVVRIPRLKFEEWFQRKVL